MKEREANEIDSLVREMLLSDPQVVAWLAHRDDELEDDEPAAAA
jgi:hypothetical protein